MKLGKRAFVVIGLIFLAFSGESQNCIEFDNLVYNWGTVEFGSKLEREIRFVNKSKIPIVVSSAMASSGAVMAWAPKEPIKPGQDGVIRFKYDTKREGAHESTIWIVYSCDGKAENLQLRIKGNVGPKKADEEKKEN